jgi:hypothetical protein
MTLVNFKFNKSTKNTVRYEEVTNGDDPPIIGTIYIQKWFLDQYPKLSQSVTICIQDSSA